MAWPGSIIAILVSMRPVVAQVSFAPRGVSPSSCSCAKIETSGTYSAGELVKCENCLDVYRSTEANSCPIGFKLFSPRNQADWQTLFNSVSTAASVAAPHWIIDVTRPSDGCGGCGTNPMNSGVAAQSTWKTANGSAWWLTSLVHNEPNGDYDANCYLNVVDLNVATTPPMYIFVDNDCAFHSSSYYCQTELITSTTNTSSTTNTTSTASTTSNPTTTTASMANAANQPTTTSTLDNAGQSGNAINTTLASGALISKSSKVSGGLIAIMFCTLASTTRLAQGCR